MALFVVPWLLLLPAKLLGLWLMGTGHFGLGVIVFVAAKLLGTAMLARLFTLTKPALLQIGWFRRLYGWFTNVRDRLFAFVKSLRAYKLAKHWLGTLRTKFRAAWQGLRRWFRRR